MNESRAQIQGHAPTSHKTSRVNAGQTQQSVYNEQPKRGPAWWALGISGVSLVLTGVGFYYNNCRGPKIEAFPGEYVFIREGSDKSKIGIPVAFANSGTETASVGNAELLLELEANEPPVCFTLSWISPSVEAEREDENGTVRPVPFEFSAPTPLAVKTSETTMRVFWFIPNRDFKFNKGGYRSVVTFYGRAKGSDEPKKVCETSLRFSISDDAYRALSKEPRASTRFETIRLPHAAP